MQKVFPFVECNNNKWPYEPCHYAKRKRLPYSLSVTKSIHTCDLINIDIWDSISIPSTASYRYFLTIVDENAKFTWIYF